MHSISKSYFVYRISYIATYACNESVNIAKYCGRAVQTIANNLFTTTHVYTQYPQPQVLEILNTGLCTFYELLTHRVVHTKCMQFVSVISSLYTQSTGPTITTTYINK